MNKNNSQNLLFALIGVVLVGLLTVGIFLMKGFNNQGEVKIGTGTLQPVTVTIIDDKRCTSCLTQEIGSELKQIPFLSTAQFVEKDFSDKGVSDFVKENKITALPAFIFSTNQVGDEGTMQQFLSPLPNGEYSLAVGAKFDPFVKRSDKGFLILDTKQIEELKKDSYIDGDETAKISWIEYSDIECPFCAKLHNSGTIEYIMGKYKGSINRVFQSFPLPFHKNAPTAAMILECSGVQGGAKTFYELAKKAYAGEKSDEAYMLNLVDELGLDRKKVELCLDGKDFSTKIQKQTDLGKTLFQITGTPGNVLINNTTGEYEIISGAYPKESFEKVIDALLK